MLEARSFAKSGADFIIGGQPHVIQGEEVVHGTYIFYSLGNFVFDMRAKQTRMSTILKIEVDDTVSYEFIPYYINNCFQSELALDRISKEIVNILQASREAISSCNNKLLLNDDLVYREYEKKYNSIKLCAVFDHFWVLVHDWKVSFIILKKMLNFISLSYSN